MAEQEFFEETLSKKVDAELAELRKAQDEKVQQIREAFGGLRQQVTRIEAVAGPKTRLTPEQLGQLRELVATLGSLLQESGVAKPYPGIYMDITRLTGVSRLGRHPPGRLPHGGRVPGRAGAHAGAALSVPPTSLYSAGA